MYLKRIWLAMAILFSLQANAQQVGQKDPKVGLVLSGGGAKGLAHIGALKAIEEAGVRIDYIGGTSMGAIVGALYAAGYTPTQLDSIFKETNFDVLLQDKMPRSAMSFYEKNNYERYAVTLPFNKFKISLPTSLSKGQNLYNLLSELLFNVNNIDDFNKLPVPFFCMATDVETGEPVQLNKGYLPKAISASAAIPSFFEPVPINDQLLIDGGVVNNYPVDEVKALGADIIIGVDVQDPLYKRDKLNSATDILVQINYYNTVNDMKEKLKKTDVHIKPEIDGFDVLSFSKGASIIENGYEAGQKKEMQLDSIAQLQLKKPEKKYPVKIIDTFLINKLSFEGNDKYTRAYLKGKLRYTTEEYTDFDNLDQGMSNLAATNNFNSVKYEIRPNKDGYKLTVPIVEKHTDMFLKLGIHYDGLYKTAGLVNITKKHLFFDDDVISFDFIVGDYIRYDFEYYLDKGFYWSFGLRSRYNSFAKDVSFDFVQGKAVEDLPDVNKLDISLDDITNQIYMQTVWKEEFTFGLGLEHKFLKIETETLANEEGNEILLEKQNYFSSYGFLKFDTLDDKYFPSKGLFFDGDFHWYLLSSGEVEDFTQFSVAKAKLGFAMPFARKFSANLFTEGGFKLGSSNANTFDFILGGWGNDFINNITPFLGYDYLSFGGDSFVKATISTDWEFIRGNHVNLTANFANAGNNIFERGEWFTLPDYSGYAIGYGYESILGPIQAKFNWSPEVDEKFFTVSVGFWF
ncbi:patatin-like phospholipase family protein [Galbibacter pacificus]|uniref:Patatin-like phospholipase family protein n=1 Tax=Galbibacter pacificus TaxID=2996052 RepID=A0ABT6FTM4_9FLAO|nr:patatin-like phospholipase family protein [Galbibacter pacificus]MDG3583137.1 patatin-like phospholipase family protein [Galbibacter pacificus]MDG3586618.1 patatin-like phospholipase family protein [Galbibacter pacificus]